MKYIQSFYAYAVTFSCIGKAIPSKDAEGDLRNIIALEDNEVEKLQEKEPFFRQLINKKKYRILNHLPESYKAPVLLVNEAKAEADKLKAELEKAKAELEALKGSNVETENGKAEADKELSYKELQEKAKELGLEKVNVSKQELIAFIKEKETEQ